MVFKKINKCKVWASMYPPYYVFIVIVNIVNILVV